MTTDKYPVYPKAIRKIIGWKKVKHRTTQYLNNYTEQSHRSIKQRYYAMKGFVNFEAADLVCLAHEELRNYFGKYKRRDEISAKDCRTVFIFRLKELNEMLVNT